MIYTIKLSVFFYAISLSSRALFLVSFSTKFLTNLLCSPVDDPGCPCSPSILYSVFIGLCVSGVISWLDLVGLINFNFLILPLSPITKFYVLIVLTLVNLYNIYSFGVHCIKSLSVIIKFELNLPRELSDGLLLSGGNERPKPQVPGRPILGAFWAYSL